MTFPTIRAREQGAPRFGCGSRVYVFGYGVGTVVQALGWNHVSTNPQRNPSFEYVVRIHQTGKRLRVHEAGLTPEE